MEDILKKLGFLAGATRFRRISEKMYIDGDKLYNDSGINFRASWFSVYYVLSKADGPVRVTDIAKQIDFTHITVKNILRQLEKKSLVIIESDKNDKRSKAIYLSPKGIKLKTELEPLWISISNALKDVFESGHPDISNILDRIENELTITPVHKRIYLENNQSFSIVDYTPKMKASFLRLVKPWLLSLLNGKIDDDSNFAINEPDKYYLLNGGFILFAKYNNEIVSCIALKRLDDESIEFQHLFTHPNYRNKGIGTKLIERTITRGKENNIKKLFFQTSINSEKSIHFFSKFGFKESKSHKQMNVQSGTKIVMKMEL